MRREWRRSRGGEPPRRIRDIASLVAVLDGRLGINAGAGGTLVRSWADQKRQPFALDMDNPVASTQPFWSGVSVDGDGIDDVLQTVAPASNYRFLHNGTGCAVALVIRVIVAATGTPQMILDTGLAPGIRIFLRTTGELRSFVYSGTALIAAANDPVVASNGALYAILWQFSTAELSMRIDEASGASRTVIDSTVGVPDAGDASLLTVLSSSSGGYAANIELYQMRMFRGLLSAADGDLALRELKGIVGGFVL